MDSGYRVGDNIDDNVNVENQSKTVGNKYSSSSFSVSNFDLNTSPASDEFTEASVPNESGGSCYSTNIISTLNGSVVFVPHVPANEKPIVGTVYSTFDDVVAFYEGYAVKSGFGIRKSTIKYNKKTTNRYLLCNRYGKRRNMSYDSLIPPEKKRRKSNFKVSNCKAQVGLQGVRGAEFYRIVSFVEEHNHALFDDDSKKLSLPNRQLQLADNEFIHKLSSSNIKPTKAHILNSLLKGGYDNVRGTVADYKNFRRDVNIYVGDRDAQMLVDKLESRKSHLPNFSFEYQVVDNELSSLFWADETAKYSYQVFGDVIAFDVTYETNLYSMIFVPFTGVDNHKRCITFSAGFLKSETIESYKWLLEAFLKTHVKQPKLVLTDQDAAVKQAMPEVFPESTHRLCMWHIISFND